MAYHTLMAKDFPEATSCTYLKRLIILWNKKKNYFNSIINKTVAQNKYTLDIGDFYLWIATKDINQAPRNVEKTDATIALIAPLPKSQTLHWFHP